MKAILYAFTLALIISGVILIGFHIIANILQNYAVYVGIPPVGTWVYPFAPFSPLVKMIGEILAVLSFILVFAIEAMRK